MKHLLIVLVLVLFIPLQPGAQDDDSYVMFHTILLTPISGHGQQLREGLKAHNEKFHQEGAQSVDVWAINSGPRSGSLLWVKGPLTWTDLDTPLEVDGHMDDWRANVAPHAEVGAFEYWRMIRGMSYMPEGFTPKVITMRYYDIKPNKWGNARDLASTGIDLYKEINLDVGWQVYSNTSPAGDGRDWAMIWFHDSWASMDKDRNYWDQYEEKYGIDRSEYFERWNETADFVGLERLVLQSDLSATRSND